MEYMGLRPLTRKILTPTLQAILKSQKLDLKYEKFAHMSPKTSRKKFLLSRFTGGRGRRAASKSRAVGSGPGDTIGGGLKSGNSFNTIDDLSESYPSEVTNKYHMRQVRDGRGSLIFSVAAPCY
jgi:hypothetical protein